MIVEDLGISKRRHQIEANLIKEKAIELKREIKEKKIIEITKEY